MKMPRMIGTRRFVLRVSGYMALVVLVTAGAAQGLAGSNTVYSDDIVNGQVGYGDLKDSAVGGRKILNGSVTGADLLDGGVTMADLAEDSVGRHEVSFGALSDVVRVFNVYTIAPNAVADVSALCPEANPVVLGGGFSWLNASGTPQPGFALRSNNPLTNLNGWQVVGQNTSQQAQSFFVHAVCASDGSSG